MISRWDCGIGLNCSQSGEGDAIGTHSVVSWSPYTTVIATINTFDNAQYCARHRGGMTRSLQLPLFLTAKEAIFDVVSSCGSRLWCT